MILINGPFEKPFLIFEFVKLSVFLLSSELNKINEESPPSPMHDILSTSMLLIFTSLYSNFNIAFELVLILLNVTLSKLNSDSPLVIPSIKLFIHM